MSREVTVNSPLEAPLTKGEAVGEIVFSYDGLEYGRSPLVSQSEIERSFLLFALAPHLRIFSWPLALCFGRGTAVFRRSLCLSHSAHEQAAKKRGQVQGIIYGKGGLQVDRPHRLKDFLNELFGVRRTPAPPPAPALAPAPADEPGRAAGAETLEPPVSELHIAISPDAVVIHEGDTVTGPLGGDTDFAVRGCVNGDISTAGSVLVEGLVKGSVTAAANITVQGGELCGNLMAGAAILLEKDSLILGNLSADVIDLAGQVKGDVHAKKPCTHSVNCGPVRRP